MSGRVGRVYWDEANPCTRFFGVIKAESWCGIRCSRIIFKDLGSFVCLVDIFNPMASNPEDASQEPGKADCV